MPDSVWGIVALHSFPSVWGVSAHNQCGLGRLHGLMFPNTERRSGFASVLLFIFSACQGHYHSILTLTPAVVSPENFFSAPAVILAEPIFCDHLTPTPCSVAPAVIGPKLRPAIIKGSRDPPSARRVWLLGGIAATAQQVQLRLR